MRSIRDKLKFLEFVRGKYKAIQKSWKLVIAIIWLHVCQVKPTEIQTTFVVATPHNPT